MRYLRKLAAPILALSLLGAVEAQTPRQPAKQYQAPQRDEEFVRLYNDVKNFETDNRKYNPESGFGTLDLLTGKNFLARAVGLAKRYGIQDEIPRITTCGNYIQIVPLDYTDGDTIFSEFVAIHSLWGKMLEKATAVPVPAGFTVSRKERLNEVYFSFGLPPVSTPDFETIRKDLITYDSEFRRLYELRRPLSEDEKKKLGEKFVKDRENQRIWEGAKYRCIDGRLNSLRRGILRRLMPKDKYQDFLEQFDSGNYDEFRGVRGSKKIIMAADGALGLTSIFSLSINPDWTAELWIRDVKDPQGTPITRQYKIEFEK